MRIPVWLLLIGLLLLPVIAAPVTAKVTGNVTAVHITTLPNGSRTYSNGTYWITWGPIGNHTVGDKFFINATTNLTAGTALSYSYFPYTYHCHLKVCNDTGWGIWNYTTIAAGDSPQPNSISIWMDTTELRGGDMDFMFQLQPKFPTVPSEYNAFSDGFYITGNLLTLPVTQSASPTRSPVPLILIPVALLGSAWIVIMKREQGRSP
jgi:hypothetical protein